MNQDEINAANRKSALEQVEQDKRNDALKAAVRAEAFMNSRPRHLHTFIGDHDERYEALENIHLGNVESSRNN